MLLFDTLLAEMSHFYLTFSLFSLLASESRMKKCLQSPYHRLGRVELPESESHQTTFLSLVALDFADAASNVVHKDCFFCFTGRILSNPTILKQTQVIKFNV
jgi:hypothetical protein